MEDKLTRRQEEVLMRIVEAVDREGIPPTVRELGGRLGGMKPPSVLDHLRALERKGFIERSPACARGIKVTRFTRLARSRRLVPIVGRIAAGTPRAALDEPEGELTVDPDLFRGECFCVRVKGDSMTGDHIMDGDFAIIRRQQRAAAGDIVAVLADGEVTLKRFARRGEAVVLLSSNPAVPPIRLKAASSQVAILGVFVGLVRKAK